MSDDENPFAYAIAELIAHAINHLDGWATPEQDVGCCWICCAACDGLHAMYWASCLDSMVAPLMATDDSWHWWVDGRVDPRWLERGWRETQFHPRHVIVNGRRLGPRATPIPDHH